jgi:hypothetical protein
MIPAFAVGIGKWLIAGNWKWAVPSAIAAGAVLYAGLQRLNYLDCKADRINDKLAHQQALLDQKEADGKLTAEILGQQAGRIAELSAKGATHTEIIRHVPVTTACSTSPAMRAADDGLRDLGFRRPGRAGAVAPDAAAPAARPRRRDRQRAGRGAHSLRRRLPGARAQV